jgi:hypothetical protein
MPSHRRSQLQRTLAAGLAAAALAAPAAHAVPNNEPNAGLAPPPTEPVPGPPAVTTIDQGFDWGSAAIGAGGAATVLLLGAAGASAASPRRRHRIGVSR